MTPMIGAGSLSRHYVAASLTVFVVALTVACGAPEASSEPDRPSAPIVPTLVAGSAAAATAVTVAPSVQSRAPAGSSAEAAGTRAPPPSGIDTPAPASASAGWCDAHAVIETACAQCHGATPLYGAPMSLLTFADLHAPSKTDPSQFVYQRVSQRIHDVQKPMPPTGFALSAASRATLDAWIGAGAPMGARAACDTPTAGQGGAPALPAAGQGGSNAVMPASQPAVDEWPADCGEHYKFLSNDNGGKSTVAPGQPPYYNITIPAPWGSGTAQALKFKPIIDNKQVIHHYILYGSDGSFVSGWAPGDQGGTMPDGVGLLMPGGNYRLEVHYNNATGATQMDGSGVELCVAKLPRPNMAAVHWLGSLAIVVPAHGTQELSSTCRPNITKGPVHLISLSPHMHKTGVHAKMVLKRASGETVIVHDKPFDFNDQQKYDLPDILVNAGDTITTTCSFENNTDGLVTFGQNTENEMCFFFTVAWPIGQLVNGSRSPDGGSTHSCL